VIAWADMARRILELPVLLILVLSCNDSSNQPDSSLDASAHDAGRDTAVDVQNHDHRTDQSVALPRLGVYTVKVDGTGLQLVVDTGMRQLSHVRPGPGGWLTATRYNEDPDGNGLAMEGEGGGQPHYGQSEVVVFDRSAPQTVVVIAGGTPAKLCANSSWTADGRLLFLHQDDPVDPTRPRFKRASFTSIPTVAAIDVVDVPPELFAVDPYQWGPSDSSGFIVFPAVFQHPSGFMRPIWRMPAAGTTSLAQVQVVGCPICPANNGCCAFSSPAAVLGTNDPTIHPLGTEVIWMHQHPDVSFMLGAQTYYPYRQHRLQFGKTQEDLTHAAIAPTVVQSYVQWRPDGNEVVYWEIQPDLTTGVVRQPLFRMAPDGSARQPIPLPADLCTSHPSYLDSNTIIFSGWRCGGAPCSCAPEKL